MEPYGDGPRYPSFQYPYYEAAVKLHAEGARRITREGVGGLEPRRLQESLDRLWSAEGRMGNCRNCRHWEPPRSEKEYGRCQILSKMPGDEEYRRYCFAARPSGDDDLLTTGGFGCVLFEAAKEETK